jgi:GDP-L-fucose synthase
MPTNLYGPHDNFNLETSHVLPALLRKVHEAKHAKKLDVVIWGTGTPLREFLHVDDMASACLFMMNQKNYNHIVNIGSGQEISIRALAELICDVVGFEGRIVFDTSKPDGTPRKLLDTSRLTDLGWKAQINLKTGLEQTYDWFLKNYNLVAESV